MNLDTQAFNASLKEFREENPYAQDRDFWELLLEDRMSIIRVAQLKKDEMISNFLDVVSL